MASETLKIMVIGLQNVGKTSILYTLEKKYSLLGQLTPTKGIQRSSFKIFGHQILAWDLGGQEQYRKSYLQKNIFFEDTDLILYCVDIRDTENTELNLDYFQKILEMFAELDHTPPPILILLNKADPDIRNTPEIRQNIEKLKRMFQDVSDVQLEFFETSIYDEWSLLKAFSFGLRQLSTKTEILSRYLAEFAQKILANAIILLNQNGYLVGEYATNELSAFACQSISTQSMYMFLIMKEKDVKPEKITVDLKEGFVVFREVGIENENFFLIFYSKVARTLELFNEYFQTFANQAKDIFSFFFK